MKRALPPIPLLLRGRSPIRPLFLTVAFVVAAPALARAHAWFTYGLGARAIAMGNAYAALADDPAAAYANPAGLVTPIQPSLSLGFSDLTFELKADGASSGIDDVPNLVFGTTFPIPLEKVLGIRAAFGFALQMTGDVLLEQDVPFPTVPQFLLLENTPRLLHLLPALAISPFTGLSVGFGALLFDNTVGALDLGLGARGDATFSIDQELKTIVSPLVGIQASFGAWSPNLQGWKAGLVFRDSFSVPYRIPVNAFLGGLPVVIDFSATAIYTPQQLETGIAYTSGGGFSAAAELVWNRWSSFPDPNLAIAVDLSIPVLPIVFTDSLARDPNFHDTWVPRVGIEGRVASWDAADLWLRAGYSFEPSPVPEQTGDTNFLDNDRHVASAGLGLAFRELFGAALSSPLKLDTYVQVHALESRVHRKDPEVDSSNPGFPDIRSSGTLFHFGLAISSELDLLDR